MPRKRNPVGIAAGKLILAIKQQRVESIAGADAAAAQKVLGNTTEDEWNLELS